MFQLKRMLSSSIVKKSLYKCPIYTINKVTKIINDIENTNKTLNIIHNKYDESTNNFKFVIFDHELKQTYDGQISVHKYYETQNFETNKDDDLFEFEMSIKSALKN
jgi:hypothetical protein